MDEGINYNTILAYDAKPEDVTNHKGNSKSLDKLEYETKTNQKRT